MGNLNCSNCRSKDDLLDIDDTTDDTRLSDIENIIMFSSSNKKNNTYNLIPNINNIINTSERFSETIILQQRENRQKISLIKKVIQKKEDNNKTKMKIKEILNTYNNNIIFLKDDQRNTLLHIYILHSLQKLMASISLCSSEEHLVWLIWFSIVLYKNS